MSYARGAGQNGGRLYSNITKPIMVNCNFIVDSTNGNGLGIRSLKSNGYIQSVFMNTSATPATGNPNPAAGFAVIRFQNNFNKYLGGFSGNVASTTGSALTATTAGAVYIITALGTATLAQWQAAGFPAGFTPAVGAPFVATTTGTIGGSAAVRVPGNSAIQAVEAIGNTNLMIGNSSIATNGGAQVIVTFLGSTSASDTTLIPKAPAAGSTVGMTFFFDDSSVTIDGL